MEEQNEKTLETYMQEVEDAVNRLENEDLTLEESFSLYEEGIKNLKMVDEAIGKVEKKMKILTGNDLEADPDGDETGD